MFVEFPALLLQSLELARVTEFPRIERRRVIVERRSQRAAVCQKAAVFPSFWRVETGQPAEPGHVAVVVGV